MTRAAGKPAAAGHAIDERRTEFYYWWLLLAIFFEYARPGAFVSGIHAAKLNTLIPVTLLVLVLIAGGLRPFGQIFDDRQVRWLLLLQVLLLVQILVADVTLYATNTFKNTLGYFFLFLIIARVATSVRRLRGIFATLAISHLFLIYMTPEVITNPGQRSYIAGGTFLSDGNDFALSLCILVPLAIALAIGAQSRVFKAVWWGVVTICLLAIVGTQSRGGTLGMLAVGAFLWYFSSRKFASLVMIALLGGIALFHASDNYFTRMSTITNYETEGSAAGRIVVWKAASRMARDHPVFGVGSGHFAIMFGARYKPKDYVGPNLTAHSSYFLVLGELGVPGFVTLIGIVVIGVVATLGLRNRLLRSGTDPPKPEAEVLSNLLYLTSASMIGFAVAGAFLSATYHPHIFVLTGVLLSVRRIALAQIDDSAALSSAPQPSIVRRGRVEAPRRVRSRTTRGSGT
jgi:putative inorganic carbon (hco3(-)) transporter